MLFHSLVLSHPMFLLYSYTLSYSLSHILPYSFPLFLSCTLSLACLFRRWCPFAPTARLPAAHDPSSRPTEWCVALFPLCLPTSPPLCERDGPLGRPAGDHILFFFHFALTHRPLSIRPCVCDWRPPPLSSSPFLTIRNCEYWRYWPKKFRNRNVSFYHNWPLALFFARHM